MSYDKELQEYYLNRSRYKFIKPDIDSQSWSVYLYGDDKQYFSTLALASGYVKRSGANI